MGCCCVAAMDTSDFVSLEQPSAPKQKGPKLKAKRGKSTQKQKRRLAIKLDKVLSFRLLCTLSSCCPDYQCCSLIYTLCLTGLCNFSCAGSVSRGQESYEEQQGLIQEGTEECHQAALGW